MHVEKLAALSVEDVVELLARQSLQQEKRAEGWMDSIKNLGTQAVDGLKSLPGHPLVDRAITSAKSIGGDALTRFNALPEEARNGLMGAGIGAVGGGLLGHFGNREKSPWSTALTGALAGGAIGAGGTALMRGHEGGFAGITPETQAALDEQARQNFNKQPIWDKATDVAVGKGPKGYGPRRLVGDAVASGTHALLDGQGSLGGFEGSPGTTIGMGLGAANVGVGLRKDWHQDHVNTFNAGVDAELAGKSDKGKPPGAATSPLKRMREGVNLAGSGLGRVNRALGGRDAAKAQELNALLKTGPHGALNSEAYLAYEKGRGLRNLEETRAKIVPRYWRNAAARFGIPTAVGWGADALNEHFTAPDRYVEP